MARLVPDSARVRRVSRTGILDGVLSPTPPRACPAPSAFLSIRSVDVDESPYIRRARPTRSAPVTREWGEHSPWLPSFSPDVAHRHARKAWRLDRFPQFHLAGVCPIFQILGELLELAPVGLQLGHDALQHTHPIPDELGFLAGLGARRRNLWQLGQKLVA
jgi:hypothetical protein